MERKVQRKLFKEKVNSFWKSKKVNVTYNSKPLYEWIVPRITSNDTLNWAEWDETVKEQQIGLIDLLGYNPCFFLWKKTAYKHFDDSDTKIISKKEASIDYLFELMIQTYVPLLQDKENKEPEQKLVYTEDDARKKIENSVACYSIEHEGVPKGLAIVSSRETLEQSFAKKTDALSCMGLGLGEQKCENILFIDVLFTHSEKGMKYGSRLLQRIENDYPNTLICLFSVPSRKTLHFYNSKGFYYSDMSVDSPNLLPNILSKLDACTEAWHDGFPMLTYLSCEIESRHPKISIFSNDFDWKIRDDIDIFFDGDTPEYFLPSYTTYDSRSGEILKYILKNRTKNRVIILAPRINMTCKKFYNITKDLLESSVSLLNDDTVEEVVVACDTNENRQLMLKQAFSVFLGTMKPEDVTIPKTTLIENDDMYNSPRKVIKRTSPPPLKYKYKC